MEVEIKKLYLSRSPNVTTRNLITAKSCQVPASVHQYFSKKLGEDKSSKFLNGLPPFSNIKTLTYLAKCPDVMTLTIVMKFQKQIN